VPFGSTCTNVLYRQPSGFLLEVHALPLAS